MADQIDALKPESVKQIVVVQKQIGNPIELLEVLGLFRARMRRRIDAAICGEIVEEAVPFLAEGTVQIDYGRAASP